MNEEAGMIRIAIGTLAIMMIAVPVAASVVASAPTRHVEQKREPMPVSQDDVLALARDQGLTRPTNVTFKHGVWTVEGAARGGAPMAINISRTGALLDRTS